LFIKNNVKIEYQNYTPTFYKQRLSNSFIPHLSIIDMLVNVGPECMKIISESDASITSLTN
jgi:hypothetical protein